MLHPLFRFRYYILFGLFAIWMAFFDMNNLFYRYKIAREIDALEENIDEHKKAIAQLEQQKQYLFGNDRNLQHLPLPNRHVLQLLHVHLFDACLTLLDVFFSLLAVFNRV